MTIRDKIDKSLISQYLLGIVCLVLFGGVYFYLAFAKIINHSIPLFLAVTAIPTLIVNKIFSNQTRCSQCNNRIGPLSTFSFYPAYIADEIKYCPFCGVDLNTEINEIANQKLEPTVKTAVESGKAQGTAGHP